ncbi:chondroitin sulfate synthase 2-like [Homalodisca vitripennis]|uniref:chondroitin sulfate synthase 2-like n=1 Tax=Homalodisca vitripennis TaxID=197043 RepID=UPI001EEBC1D3|nr:chondroitin sulfate synthase 2-like [Homalodisca vitripennis]XP_046685953.1 chondroitin sulfate synthase 2-like [Homalodisca vitripennis]
MIRLFHSVFRQNSYFIISFTLGVCLSIYMAPLFVQNNCTNFNTKIENDNARKTVQVNDAYEPKINLAAKPKIAMKAGHGIIRPRFHKAELGIRNKLFLGVLTSPESISSLAVALNKTASKFVSKIMFFIDAPSAQRLNVSLLKLPGIVGFTDTRQTLKPFHLIKYVSDNFLEDYDFFFIIKDTSYIQAQKLSDYAKKISIIYDIHVGRTMQTIDESEKICSLDSGILLSNSVVKKMQRSLEWCVKNAVTKDDNVNFGRCVFHASQVPCSDSAQGTKFQTFVVRKGQLNSLIPSVTADNQRFDNSIIIGPLSKAEHYYTIHFYFSMKTTTKLNIAIEDLRKSVVKLSKSQTAESRRWPVASQPPAVPLSHFDVVRWDHFTLTHKYLNNDFTNLVPLSGADKEDIQRIISAAITHVEEKYESALKFHRFINGYQKFDPSRGMDYIIDLEFRETTSGKTIHKRFELFKSLGKVEMVPVPYVTENVRVHVVIPVQSADSERIMTFLKQYSINAMEKKDLQFLMLVFIYNSHESSKGDNDIFKEVKNKALSLSNKFEKLGNLIKWHSIKLPGNGSDFAVLTESLLDFAVMDSVLKKFSPESLVLVGRPNMEVRLDYFNRVRMNTVLDFQVFSPIPFTEYHPDIIYNENRPQPPELDINKNYGHYDSTNFKHISFYTADYLKARKKIEDVIPLVKYDKDIWKLTPKSQLAEDSPYHLYTRNGIYNMFVKNSKAHILRAVEPSLRLRHSLETCVYCRSQVEFNDYCTRMQAFNLATRSQLGRLILDHQAHVAYPRSEF